MLIQMWEGMGLQITEAMVKIFPKCSYLDFPENCCGAGDGIWEKVVPDYIYIYPIIVHGAKFQRIKISPACTIHDLDYDLGPPTWDHFHESNSRLYANIKTIVQKHTIEGSNAQIYALRFPAIYAHAVDTAGRKIFWKIKQEQGFKIPDSASWLI
jgi:hypothetical protein